VAISLQGFMCLRFRTGKLDAASFGGCEGELRGAVMSLLKA